MRVLLTGAAGFIGHHVLSYLLDKTDWEIVALVKMDKVGDLRRIQEECPDTKRCLIVWNDLKSPVPNYLGNFNLILHFGAETHVDDSIANPMSFVMSNVVGTANLLEFALRRLDGRFLYFSTDEVFGPAPVGVEFKPHDVHNPNNPYAATKSAAEQLVKAYRNTYALPVLIVRGMNVFGERQHPQKFIPKVIGKLLKDELITIHASKDGTPGSRFYIYAKDVADGVRYALGLPETEKYPTYHIVGEREVDNLTLVRNIADIMGKTDALKYELVDFHSSRPGHDLRYALAEHLPGWSRPSSFDQRLRQTVEWYLAYPGWLDG